MKVSNDSMASFVSKYKGILDDPETKHSFYMQELESASKGNKASKEWASSKGVDPSEYKDALWNEENVAAEHLQMAILGWQMRRPSSRSGAARGKERCAVVDSLMAE
tara:strand:+ start:1473 stop:1793 length:321 start_codon:yes stop_codon:yes gene_type:complete